MAYLYVDTKKLDIECVRLNEINRKLELAKNSFEQTQKKIVGKMPMMAGNLIYIEHGLEKQLGISGDYGKALEKFITLYREHEKVVLSNTSTSSNSPDKSVIDPSDMSYEEYLNYRYENAVDETTKEIYKKYKDKIKIKDDAYDGTAHYNGIWNEIKYNAEDDAKNERGSGYTYYHEVGHLIDDQSDWNSYTSTDWSYDFYDKLKADINNWINKIKSEQGYTDIQDVYDYMETWLFEDANNKNGISDLVKGITDGNVIGRWGHDINYYSSSSIPKEAFAHFFEAGMRTDSTKLDYIKEIFPTAYEEFQKMLRDELK